MFIYAIYPGLVLKLLLCFVTRLRTVEIFTFFHSIYSKLSFGLASKMATSSVVIFASIIIEIVTSNNYFIDILTTYPEPVLISKIAYPTDICVPITKGSTINTLYAIYNCVSNSSIIKTMYNDSMCSQSISNEITFTETAMIGELYEYNCNSMDSRYTIIEEFSLDSNNCSSPICSSTLGSIYYATDICYPIGNITSNSTYFKASCDENSATIGEYSDSQCNLWISASIFTTNCTQYTTCTSNMFISCGISSLSPTITTLPPSFEPTLEPTLLDDETKESNPKTRRTTMLVVFILTGVLVLILIIISYIKCKDQANTLANQAQSQPKKSSNNNQTNTLQMSTFHE